MSCKEKQTSVQYDQISLHLSCKFTYMHIHFSLHQGLVQALINLKPSTGNPTSHINNCHENFCN